MSYSFSGILLGCAMLFAIEAKAQKKADKKIIRQLREDVSFLASDELEGRRTATTGEQKAAFFLEDRYRKVGIGSYKGNYRHPFKFIYGKEIAPPSQIRIGTSIIDMPAAGFPLPFSANTSTPIESNVLPDVPEQGGVWLLSLYTDPEDAGNPHFDYEKAMYDRAKEAKGQGASAVVFYDAAGAKYPPRFNAHSELEQLDIPVLFLSNGIYQKFIEHTEEGVALELNVHIRKSEFTGTNVAAYIDNEAPYTVVLGAHYDHLGFGEDGNSLFASKEKAIHNGADDNASGTAGLLQLASWIRKKKLRNYNYLFVHFSGEELGLLGSKAIVKEYGLDSNRIAYMLNMDMIGRLNDSTRALTVGGVGTSPAWGPFVSKKHKELRFVIDSTGVGPSDHTSFYHAGIPVLFFFTGLHHDYHKPSDDAEKVNYAGELTVLKYIYSITEVMDTRLKPKFTPTKQNAVGKVRFKVTLGIMPDYSFQDGGVRVDGVSEDKPAQKAGIRAGDIITRMGDHKIQSMQSYMEALSHFKSGQTIDVTVNRNGQPLVIKLTF